MLSRKKAYENIVEKEEILVTSISSPFNILFYFFQKKFQYLGQNCWFANALNLVESSIFLFGKDTHKHYLFNRNCLQNDKLISSSKVKSEKKSNFGRDNETCL